MQMYGSINSFSYIRRRDRSITNKEARMITIANPIYDIVFKYLMEDNAEMQLILRRLLMAATNTDRRMDMNVEDEYYSIIESRETEIMQLDRRLAEHRVALSEAKKIISQSEQLSQKDEQLSEKDEQLRKSIKLLLQANLSIEQIASSLGISRDVVQTLAK